MADIYALALIYRQQAVAREEQALRGILDAYVGIYQAIESDVERLAADILAQRAAGVEVNRNTILRHERMQAILQQVEREIGRVARNLGPEIERAQRDLLNMGEQHARQMMLTELLPAPVGISVSFNRFNPSAVENMVGFLADGTPLRAILDELGPDASATVRDKLIQGIGRGQNPRVVARGVLDAFGGNYARAERVARTEGHRAYREASRQTYQQNRQLLEGWVWTAARDERVCMSCVLMDGTVHQVDEIFGSHVNCRCAMRPRTKSWEDLGFTDIEDTRTPLNSGEDWFLQQSPEKQLAMMGPSKFAAWQDGAFSLRELVHEHVDPSWGLQRTESSLRGMIGLKQAQQYYGGRTPERELLMAAD